MRDFARIMRAGVLILVAALVPMGSPGQRSSGNPAFEVASIKPSDLQGGSMGIGLRTYPGGRIVATNSTLRLLIGWALDTELFQFPGAPGWVNDDRFDVEARPPASSASSKANPPRFKDPPNDEQRRMLLTLLVERFGLKFHRDTKEGPVYLLVKGNKELRLHEAKDKDAFPWAGPANGGVPFGDGIAGINISMPQLAKRLTPFLGRPVVDQTGLNGSFDFKYAADEPHSDIVSTILLSMQELGLRLESSKGPVETIVIDHAEKPSAN